MSDHHNLKGVGHASHDLLQRMLGLRNVQSLILNKSLVTLIQLMVELGKCKSIAHF